ncbi:hypothetical protein BDB00DRAFT_803330 [Zychaea mexicana]|uniref:uncharacterized protein n=1 Tax=Zychaea mexicana TaxID=64656 RepID=UPI0022FE9EB8|nr:uncharacterized protein BDB00DRAFT_803330 [Zychaea mexicana]KAI9497600.1 hypothetical protein BDB00DRAFT_803330 [Zychaea mexicana]
MLKFLQVLYRSLRLFFLKFYLLSLSLSPTPTNNKDIYPIMSAAHRSAETALVLNQKLDESVAAQLSTTITECVQALLDGQYTKVLREHSPIFDSNSNNSEAQQELLATGNIEAYIDQQLQRLNDDDNDTQFIILATGIACLNAFVQTNWTGPLLDWSVSELLTGQKKDAQLEQKIHDHCLESLSADSEQVYHLTQRLGLLAAARRILLHLRDKNNKNSAPLTTTASFWAMRAVFIQQQLLDEFTASLQNLLLELAQECHFEENDDLCIRLELELGLIYSYYGQDKEAFENIKKAQETSGFQWSLSGALGRRTKHQTFDVSQLVLLAESKEQDSKENKEGKEEKLRPETVELQDDTLLDQVAFAKTDKNDQEADKRHGNLRVIDQCLLLAFCLNVKNTNPDHGLTATEMTPYVTRVLENANNWMVHTMGLLHKTRLEAHKSRTVERSALQLQALVDQIKVEDSGVDERMAYFYDLLLPSKWEMERELAKRFVSLGVLRSALDIFERLEMWEEVVSCYQMLEQPTKAKEVLSRLMDESPNSPKLWCILGDVEQNPDHWRKAWEVSGHRFARAMRSLGAHLYRQQDFDGCIDCYQKALAINPLFEGSWYVLGCAGMQAEQWEVSMRAFQRVVALDNEQAEAWNNLSSIYVQMDRKPDAFLALKQATKLKFDNWRMWQNLLIVAADVGQFADAIWAMQRIVELRWDKARDDCVDSQVLQMLVDNVILNWKDAFDRDGVRLQRQVQRLLEEVILSRITNSPEIWRICAKFYLFQKRYSDALEASVKGYRAVMHDARIETDQEVFERVASVAMETVDMYESIGDQEQDNAPVCADWKYQARLILKGLMGRTREAFEDTEAYERLKDRLDDFKRA